MKPAEVRQGGAGEPGGERPEAQIERLVGELREREAALEAANQELQDAARHRSMQLARMSHELRTPLTAILGFAELLLLEHEALTDRQRQYCERIQSSGRYLQWAVKKLVDLSRLEAGKIEPFLHEFSAREMLREACAGVAPLADGREVKLECATAPDCGSVVSDEGQLRQVIYNLLANAIARSPEGGTVRLRATAPTTARIRFEIEDDGEPHGDATHILEASDCEHRIGECANADELGLAIARRLIDLLGGTVEVNRGDARGQTVRLEFPVRPPGP